jgi:hypothetical protein
VLVNIKSSLAMMKTKNKNRDKNDGGHSQKNPKQNLPACVCEIESPSEPAALGNKYPAVGLARISQGRPIIRLMPLPLIDVVLCHKNLNDA